MQIGFYATLRKIVGAKYAEVSVPEGASLQEVLDAVVGAYPDLKEELLDEAGRLSRHVHLFVDGRSSKHLPDGLDTRVHAGQTVEFFPAVAGG
ncbi:MAG: MoaD family protein [Proteobacteria bacterium]|nr:MoaD family protein [Pseudomonadota bacterium]